MAVETWGIDLAFVTAYYPTLLISATAKLTPTQMDEIVQGAAAEVNGYIDAAFGSGTVAEIGATVPPGPPDVQYRNAQTHTIRCAGPALHIAAEGASAAVLDTLDKARDESLEALRDDPARALGRVQDATMFPGVDSSTKYRNLDTSTTALRGYREHDGRNAARGVDTGGYKW